MLLVQSLPSEFDQALKRLTYIITESTNYQHKLSPNIWNTTESTAILKTIPKIRDIPSGKEWKWKQARKRYIMKFGQNTIEITKLVPRKPVKSNLQCLPKIKLWQGIVSDRIGSDYVVYWCEKGADLLEQPELQIEDFSFLSKFMNEDLSKLFWPNVIQS